MGKIRLENIKLHSNHGCLDEEGLIGSEYRIDIEIEANLETSSVSDELSDTVDYVLLHHIAKQETLIRSKLLENVVWRIQNRILKEIPEIETIWVRLAKINPPIQGNVEKVSVELSKTRLEFEKK